MGISGPLPRLRCTRRGHYINIEPKSALIDCVRFWATELKNQRRHLPGECIDFLDILPFLVLTGSAESYRFGFGGKCVLDSGADLSQLMLGKGCQQPAGIDTT
jgi:hypothetical protein